MMSMKTPGPLDVVRAIWGHTSVKHSSGFEGVLLVTDTAYRLNLLCFGTYV